MTDATIRRNVINAGAMIDSVQCGACGLQVKAFRRCIDLTDPSIGAINVCDTCFVDPHCDFQKPDGK